MAARQQLTVERIVSTALAKHLAGCKRMQQMAERCSRERFFDALDRVSATSFHYPGRFRMERTKEPDR